MDLLTYQTKLYEAIKALNYDVYDYVPLDAPFPYVRLDANQTISNGTKTSDNYDVLQYINIFSSYRGSKEIREIAQNIIQAIKGIEGTRFIFRDLVINQVQDKEQQIQNQTKGSIYQATLVFKLKI